MIKRQFFLLVMRPPFFSSERQVNIDDCKCLCIGPLDLVSEEIAECLSALKSTVQITLLSLVLGRQSPKTFTQTLYSSDMTFNIMHQVIQSVNSHRR